jgi:hypothetical protein
VALAGGGPLQEWMLTMTQLMSLVLFVLAVYGLANAIAVLKIGRFFIGTCKERKTLGRIPYVGAMFYCPPCLSFWIGMACSHWFFSPAQAFVGSGWKAMVVDGLVACAAVYILHLVAERIGHGLDI